MSRKPAGGRLRDPHEERLGYQMRRVSIIAAASLARALEPLDLKLSEAVVLRFIGANPGCNQGEIGRELGMQRANMVPIIAGLADVALIVRRTADGRSNALELTPAGTEMAERIAGIEKQHERTFFGDVDPSLRAAMLTWLRDIRASAAA